MATNLNTVARANLRASKGKYTLTGIGIGISAFFIAAVLILMGTLQSTLSASVGDMYSKMQTVVASAGASSESSNSTREMNLTPAQIKALENDSAVDKVWAAYSVQNSITINDSKSTVLLVQAPTDTALSPFPIEGKLPSSSSELMVSKSFATKNNLSVGSKLNTPNLIQQLNNPNGADKSEYTVTAIFETTYSGSSANSMVLIGGTELQDLATAAAAESANAGTDAAPAVAAAGSVQLPLASVILKDNSDQARADLQARLDTKDAQTAPKVFSGEEYVALLQKRLSSMFGMLTTVLGAFALLALLVSSFVISNTFAVLVGQRIRELALLRTLGARGNSLVRMLLVEALAIGAIFSVIGAALAFALAFVVSLFFDSFVIAYDPSAFVIAVILCTLVTVLASLAPARTALRISPISAMRETTSMALRKPHWAGLVVGLLLAAVGVLSMSTALGNRGSSSGLTYAFLGTFLLAIAVFALAPWILVPVIRIFGLFTRSQTGKLALANALRAPKRTVSTGRAVLVGTMIVTIVLSGHSVLSASITSMMDKVFPVAATANYGGSTTTDGAAQVSRAESTLSKVQGIKNVDYAVVSYAAGTVNFGKAENADPSAPDTQMNMTTLSEEQLHRLLPAEANTSLKDNEVLVPALSWDAFKFNDSTRLTAKGPKGELQLKPVKANSRMTDVFVTPATGAKLQDPKNPTAIETASVDIPEGVPAEVAAQIAASAPTGNVTMLLVQAKTPLNSQENAALQEELTKANGGDAMSGSLSMRQMFDQVLGILLNSILALLALAVVISIIGIANTMTLSVNERRRENSMLRALGLSRSQLKSMISLEAIVITLSAVVVSVIAGVNLGALTAISVLDKDAEIVLALPYPALILVLVVGLLSALAAAALPASRSAKLSPVQGMRTL